MSVLRSFLFGSLGSYAVRAEALGISIAGAYRTMRRPATEKNIGRNRLKSARSKYMPHQGRRECDRRLRQRGRIAARRPAEGGAAP